MRFVQDLWFVLLTAFVSVLLATPVKADTIADVNPLSGATATMSSSFAGGGYTAVGATDGKCYDASDPDKYAILFDLYTGNQRVAITGFNATNGIGDIRIWAKSNLHRAPMYFAAWSSTNANTNVTDGTLMDWDQPTNTATHFETCLQEFPPYPYTQNILYSAYGHAGVDPTNPTYSYVDMSVNAPAGTKSLLICFGSSHWVDNASSTGDYSTESGGVLVGEIQAFAAPEPSAVVLLTLGLFGLLCYAWRKRK